MLYISGLMESALLIENNARLHFGDAIELSEYFAMPMEDNRVVLSFRYHQPPQFEEAEQALMELDAIEQGLRIIAGENYYVALQPFDISILGLSRDEVPKRLDGVASAWPAADRRSMARHRIGVQGDAAVIRKLLDVGEKNNINAIIMKPDSDVISFYASSPMLFGKAAPYKLEAVYEGTRIEGQVSGGAWNYPGLARALDMAHERRVSIARVLYEAPPRPNNKNFPARA